MAPRCSQHGLTLIELLLAMVAALIVIGALNGVLMLGFEAQASGREANELVYDGRFAIERMSMKARSTAPKRLSPPILPNSTGDWFAPTMYCLKGGSEGRLVESHVSDTACAGSNVIAKHVIALLAQVPSSAGPVDDPVGTLSVTLQSGGAPITLTTSVRLGGGAL
jgi:prepilin-type N-terminal cleavage/methylation domain-containing protein